MPGCQYGTAGAELGRQWSVGLFTPGAAKLPEACVCECTGEDSAHSAERACPAVRELLSRANGSAAHVPATCERGYRLSLKRAEEPDGPDVLVLRPAQRQIAEEVIAPAVHSIESLAAQNWQLEQENQGLAGEVLRSYEQINLIFDVSAQIATLNDANEVRRMLLSKLRHLFDADRVVYVAPDWQLVREVTRDGQMRRGWTGPAPKRPLVGLWPSTEDGPGGGPIELPPEFQGVLEQLAQSRRVLVCSDDGVQSLAGHGTSMWGPLSDGGADFGLVGIIRRSQPFVSGDMLVLDSALTYGTHILSNLRLVEQLKRTSFEAVSALVNAVDQKDTYTCGHSERVGFLARITGEYLRLPAPELQQLQWAGLLHDVGKIGIPERVLNKPGGLTMEEYALIREHPSRSFEVLSPVASLEPVLEAVLYHHENADGSGYPRGLKGEQIPLAARIIHVVDVFDALTSSRSYRKAYTVDSAIALLQKDAGSKLDARIVEAFLGAWALLPQMYPEQHQKLFGSAGPARGQEGSS